jgi:hypothetical protein
MKTRISHWLWRYLPAECASIVGALLAANVIWDLTDNAAAAAIAGAWGENLGYYSVMMVREVRATSSLWHAARNLVLEFGVAEVLDSVLIRPACMYVATRLVNDLSLGVLIGKLVADVVFYVPAIAAYELRKRYLPASRDTTGAKSSMTRSNTIT